MAAARTAWRAGRLHDLLGVQHPIVQGPFGGGLSAVRLTAAVSNAGGLGSYGAHILDADAITDLVARLYLATDRPFAVNLWIPQPGEEKQLNAAEHEAQVALLRPYLAELGLPEPPYVATSPSHDFTCQVEALLAVAPPVISFVMGVPSPEIIDEAHRSGTLVFGTATTVAEAVALADAGVDAVVASGSDAGGHRGAFLAPVGESLVGTMALIPQVVDAVEVPVIAAGGIADARGIAAALMLGADGVQLGTAFLGTHESGASAVHKAELTGPNAATTVLTRVFTGRTARGIPNRFVREMTPHEATLPHYPVQNALTAPIRQEANRRGMADYIHLWAGQAAALTRPAGAAELVASLVRDTDALLG